MKRFVSLSMLIALAFVAVVPGGAIAQEEANIVETAVAAGNFTMLAAALEAAGLVDALQGEGPFTVFAPTDDAFNALPEGTFEALQGDIPALTDILTYHVVPGALPAAEVVSRSWLPMLNGAPALIDGATINGANIVATDIFASNGVIHVIDAVILPPEGNIVETAVNAGSFTSLVAAVEIAGLVDALSGPGPLTVFAPTDDAFNALPEGTFEALQGDIPTLTDILTYHVVPGALPAADVLNAASARMLNGAPVLFDGAMINDANIVTTDILTRNGIIHVIDAVILPPDGDIVDTALAVGGFTALAGALTQADLVDTLKGEGPFTVFAPTDEAFTALGEETIAAALADPTLLTSILLYHVAPGILPAAEVVAMDAIPTAMGEQLTVSTEDGVKIENANVVTADILTRNGIIHVIDAVLLPQTPAEDARCAAIVNTGANLRAGPSTEFGRIGGLPEGAEVQVIGQNADGSWYELLLTGGGRGWIAGFLLDNLTCPEGFEPPAR
ncbi:MAG: fasciclin domain-containing protein [Anaerolineae bacterium]|nr:fasciclin domain-containing protein [Anaerolineae bacterium]